MDRKKWIALIVVIVVLLGLGGYYYYRHTPTYTFRLIETAVKEHDWATFDRHVDVKGMTEGAFDDFLAYEMENDKTMDDSSKAMALGFAQMFKPVIVGAVETGVRTYVETGAFQDEDKDAAKSKQDPGKQAANEIMKTADESRLTFQGIKSTEKDGKTALVTLGIHDGQYDADFEVKLRLNQLDDGTWRVMKLDNLKELIEAVREAEKKKLAELNEPIRAEMDNAVKIGTIKAAVQGKSSFSQVLALSANLTIGGDKAVKSFGGTLTMTAPDGSERTSSYTYTVKAGAKTFTLQKDLNPFITFENGIIKQKAEGYQFALSVDSVEYADGTKTQLLKAIPKE